MQCSDTLFVNKYQQATVHADEIPVIGLARFFFSFSTVAWAHSSLIVLGGSADTKYNEIELALLEGG